MEFGKVLEGVKVVELGTYIAAPSASRLLADWGAEVIKIEGPGPDPIRAWGADLCNTHTREENPIHQFENANKLGIGLNLKTEGAREILDKLLGQADVFITNTRLQSLAKLGLDYETLHAKFPRLVWAHVTGMGTEGPEAAKPGFDITAFWSRSGALLDPAEAAASVPNTSPYGAGDHTLALGLTAGILAALLRQRATGEGEKVTASLLGTAAYTYSTMIVSTQYGDEWPKSRLKVMSPLNASYRCADGEWFMLTVIQYQRMYEGACKVLGLDHLIDDPRYNTFAELKKDGHDTELVKMIDEAFATHDSAYWDEAFTRADIPHEIVRHFKDVKDDPQAWANGNLSTFTFENGHEAVFPSTPIQFSTNVAPPNRRAPHLGEHNEEVLKRLGYDDAQIAAFLASGDIFQG